MFKKFLAALRKTVMMSESLANFISEYLPMIWFVVVIALGCWFYFFGPHGIREISLYVPDKYNLTSEIAGGFYVAEIKNSEEEERQIKRLSRVEDFKDKVEEGDIVEIVLLRRVPDRLDVVYSLRKGGNTFLMERSYDKDEAGAADWAEGNLKARIKPLSLFFPYDLRHSSTVVPFTFFFAIALAIAFSVIGAILNLALQFLKYCLGC